MGNDPAVSWYWNDWHGGTITFSRHVKGCYMDLLHAQFNNGRLSLDEIKTVLGADFSYWNTLQKKFEKDDNNLYYNEKLENEIHKRKAYRESRKRNLSTHMDTHMKPHMDIDKEIDKDIGKENKEGVKGEDKLYQEIIDDFNSVTGQSLTLTESRTKLLNALFKENPGYTLDDFKKVHKIKQKEWTGTKFEKFIRPSTLWTQIHFSEYLGQKEEVEINNQKKPCPFCGSIIHHAKSQTDCEYQKANEFKCCGGIGLHNVDCDQRLQEAG